MRKLREMLPREFPDTTFSFPPADIVSQILNFGSPAPIDVQVRGRNIDANFDYASKLLKRIRAIPGVADARIQQSQRAPLFKVDVDRTQAQLLGLTTRDVTNSLVVNLAGSSQVAPTYWLNPAQRRELPDRDADAAASWTRCPRWPTLPVGNGANASAATLGGDGALRARQRQRAWSASTTSRRWCRSTPPPRTATWARVAARHPQGARRNRAPTCRRAPRSRCWARCAPWSAPSRGLLFGLLGAVGLIYLLIVVNFQSWLDPAVIVSALPAALAGIVWMLFATHTTLSVPALTGAIMCMGVATANSVLVISFARERLDELGDAAAAALEAGFVRFRPVLMTALAMVIGMLPMALGLGEGGEQNAPLGRAVIGGLVFSTIATLVFVPVVFSLVHGRRTPARAGCRPATPIRSSCPCKLSHHLAASVRCVIGVARAGRRLPPWWSAASRPATRRPSSSRSGRGQAVPTVSLVATKDDRRRAAGTAGPHRSLVARADLRPRERLPEELERRHRRAGEGRPGAGRRSKRPDLDQDLRQAKAQLAVARSNLALAESTAKRWQSLVAQNAVSKQEADEKQGDFIAKQSQRAGRCRPASSASRR